MFPLIKSNWKSGLTVALISVPLSIALSVASGAGPIPGVITGIWATAIAALFGGSNYNVIGAAGALTTVLFAATLAAPLGLGAAVLPLIALLSGLMILGVWAIGADRFLYYIPSSVMYGFAGGVALLIAAAQLFDATGLSALKRTGTFIGDIQMYVAHAQETHTAALVLFLIFLTGILVWKRFVRTIPAVIPAAVLGIAVGWFGKQVFVLDVVTLGDKFGTFAATLVAPVPWGVLPQLLATRESLLFLLGTAGTVALISVLETLITMQIGDKITKTQSSSRKELFGLALANLGAGAMGGLPATGVFIRTGANIKAGATHRTSALIAAAVTAVIALIALPFFTYIPMAVIAAILVNTALGLIEIDKFVEFFKREKRSFAIALVVLLVTVLEDAGIAVVVGAVLALFFFVDRVSHGYFDAIINYTDGSKEVVTDAKVLYTPDSKPIAFITYSIAGSLGYIDSPRHAANLRQLAQSKAPFVIVRLRDLFALDYEGEDMLAEALTFFSEQNKVVYVTSGAPDLLTRLNAFPAFAALSKQGRVFPKSEDAIRAALPEWSFWHSPTQHAKVAR